MKYKINSELKHTSFCIISDDMTHDVAMVYEVQKRIIDYLKCQLPDLKNVEYFSDGCAGQYKNRKNFYNLCHHKADFNIEEKWIFFATNHGKQPCDGIGGTVKRLVAKASLQRPYNEQILTPTMMFQYCKNTIKDIEFIYVQQDELQETRKFLKLRFERIKSPVPGTRSFHEFSPLNDYKIAVKRCSEDTEFALIHNFKNKSKVSDEFTVLQYVTCIYEMEWWIGIIREVDKEQDDARINFITGRQYSITQAEAKKVEELMLMFNS